VNVAINQQKESTMSAVAELKNTHRGVWAAGNYSAVAEHIDDIPPADLLAQVGITAGHNVLDVATGTGNLALKAARRGAHVTGLDLTPELLAVARDRAQRAGLDIDWIEGDAEDLPFADDGFDRITSVFGVQFAPRHEVVAEELARVCRPGGRIGLANWTPHGLIGAVLKLIGGAMPAPPAFASPPPLWGSEEHVRALFAELPVEPAFAYGRNPWRFASAEHFVAFMETQYGPTLKARERLTADGRWDDCRRDMVAIADSFNEATDGTLLMQAEYLIVVGKKS
jgi:SAM-dependent methyltransferase